MIKSKIYIALEDINYQWQRWEVMAILHHWNEGHSLEDIAKQMSRDVDELAILLIDIGEFKPGLVGKRSYGIHESLPLSLTTYYNKMMENLLGENPIYVAFEQTGPNMIWDDQEVHRFDELWHEGETVCKLSKIFRKKPLEVCLLAIDRCKKGMILPRKIGLGVVS